MCCMNIHINITINRIDNNNHNNNISIIIIVIIIIINIIISGPCATGAVATASFPIPAKSASTPAVDEATWQYRLLGTTCWCGLSNHQAAAAQMLLVGKRIEEF